MQNSEIKHWRKFRKFGILDKVDVTTLNNALLITTDVPNFYRVDGIEGLKFDSVIKIDHHPFEEDFGGIEWIDEFEIQVKVENGTAVISANREGMLSLAKHLISLANGAPGDHIHYDEYNSLETGSAEMIIERV